MTRDVGASTIPPDAVGTLLQLALSAGLSDDRSQLAFRMLNRSITYCRYDRAVLWGLATGRARLLGVSGQAGVDARAPLVDQWRRLVDAIPDPGRAAILDARGCAVSEATWEALAQRTSGLSVVWLPIVVAGRVVAGLWLERWGDAAFEESDVARLRPLALAYQVAWRSVVGVPGRVRSWLSSRKGVAAMILGVTILAALCLVRVPLRIVAPCEVVPDAPVSVTAPLDGVVEKMPVLPGRDVAQGDLLAVYDKRVAIEELNVAQEQVRIAGSELQRARVQAFDNNAVRSAIALLENRLKQEEIRLGLAQHRVSKLDVCAPVAGTLMFDDPYQWRGRPVQVGELMMMIVDPARTKLRIWLPHSDNIEFDTDRPVTVILDSDPSVSRSARLSFLANRIETATDGTPSFRAEADWATPDPTVRMGLQGTAVLYGHDVSLGYWLMRRPLAAVRSRLGL